MTTTETQPIDARTRFCAVLGHPVRHSASPAMQNAAFEAMALPWRYLAFDVPPTRLRQALDGAAAMGFLGLNLTVPHKLLAVDMVDAIDESARVWGAVNTIRFEARDANGEWKPLGQFQDAAPEEIRSHGFNTDADALVRALREDLQFEPAGASILLLGAGGAGRVAALKLAALGASRLFLVNRTTARAETVAADIRRAFPRAAVTVGYPRERVDLALNATSLGLNPGDALPFDATVFEAARAAAAYDMIYRPAETPFLKAARAAGARVANGLGMLLHQGAQALALWSGRTPPIDLMREALRKNVYGGG